jgi:hypothetical protein
LNVYGDITAQPLIQVQGAVSVQWRADDGALSLCWSETGGPLAKAPGEAGFGSRLEHDPEKCEGGFPKRSCSIKDLKRDGDST